MPPGSTKGGHADVFKSLRTNAEGAFALESIEPGKYDVEIASPGFNTFLQHEIEIRSGTKVNLGRLTLGVGGNCLGTVPWQPPSIELRGLSSNGTRVSGYAYEPLREPDLSRASIVLTGLQGNLKTVRTVADSKGKYVFEMVAPGTYRLKASLRGHASFVIDKVPVEAGQETVLGGFPLESCPFFAFCGSRKRFRQITICE